MLKRNNFFESVAICTVFYLMCSGNVCRVCEVSAYQIQTTTTPRTATSTTKKCCEDEVEGSEAQILTFVCKTRSVGFFVPMYDATYKICKDPFSDFIVNEPGMEISEVTDSYGIEIGNLSSIEGVSILSAKMTFIPNGFKKMFPNLKVFAFIFCKISYIDKENMRQFGWDLEIADLSSNSITHVDADLFQYNPNIKFIDFSFCSIKFIEPGFFENLKIMKQIAYVRFFLSECIDQNFKLSEGDNIQTFKWNDKNCTHATAWKENYMRLPSKMRKMKNVNDEFYIQEKLFDLENKINDQIKEELNNQQYQVCEKSQTFDYSQIILIVICVFQFAHVYP